MPVKPTIGIYPDLGGGLHVAYPRNDCPLAHTIVRAEQGAEFDPGSHWPCDVCEEHGFSPGDFAEQWPAALAQAKGTWGE